MDCEPDPAVAVQADGAEAAVAEVPAAPAAPPAEAALGDGDAAMTTTPTPTPTATATAGRDAGDLMQAGEAPQLATGAGEESSSAAADAAESDGEADAGMAGMAVDLRTLQPANKSAAEAKTANELFPHELPPEVPVEISLPEAAPLERIGTVKSTLNSMLIIGSTPGSQALDTDSILWLEDRSPLGRVFEVFGPVVEPFYSVRLGSGESYESGTLVFFAPDFADATKYVLTSKLSRQKGSDASWAHDEEPPAEIVEFSDDEEERAAKQQHRRAKLLRKQLEAGAEAQGMAPPGSAAAPMEQQRQPSQPQRLPQPRPHRPQQPQQQRWRPPQWPNPPQSLPPQYPPGPGPQQAWNIPRFPVPPQGGLRFHGGYGMPPPPQHHMGQASQALFPPGFQPVPRPFMAPPRPLGFAPHSVPLQQPPSLHVGAFPAALSNHSAGNGAAAGVAAAAPPGAAGPGSAALSNIRTNYRDADD